jgi:hypothetical protein
MPSHIRDRRHWTDEPDESYRPTGRLSAESDRARYGTGGYRTLRERSLYGRRDLGYPGSFEESRDQEREGVARSTGNRGKGPRNYQRSDERIRELVCEALMEDDTVDATAIEVTVENGEVVLAGSVIDRAQKRAAEDAIEHIFGIRDVQNLLRISR